ITRVLPLPAPARINTGPSTVSTASRCCGFNCERNDRETAPELRDQNFADSILQERSLLPARETTGTDHASDQTSQAICFCCFSRSVRKVIEYRRESCAGMLCCHCQRTAPWSM